MPCGLKYSTFATLLYFQQLDSLGILFKPPSCPQNVLLFSFCFLVLLNFLTIWVIGKPANMVNWIYGSAHNTNTDLDCFVATQVCQDLPTLEGLRSHAQQSLSQLRTDHKRALNPTPYKVGDFLLCGFSICFINCRNVVCVAHMGGCGLNWRVIW